MGGGSWYRGGGGCPYVDHEGAGDGVQEGEDQATAQTEMDGDQEDCCEGGGEEEGR